jgi:hypothetical protein
MCGAYHIVILHLRKCLHLELHSDNISIRKNETYQPGCILSIDNHSVRVMRNVLDDGSLYTFT